MSKSIITTATFDKILVAKDKATVTLTMGPEMLYLAPQMATMAGEEVLVSIARNQERLPLDGSDE